MKKPDVEKIMRATMNPTMSELGFRWKRMRSSSDGHYVRSWDGGHDTLSWGIASYSPRYSIGSYATLRLDEVQNLVTPQRKFDPPEAALDSWTCNVNDLFAFTVGPDLRPGENMARAKRMVETEAEVQAFAEWLKEIVLEHIEPWWRANRTAKALWSADPKWRKFWSPVPPLNELAVAFLCAPADVQEELATKTIAAARAWPEMYQKQIALLIDDLRARRES